MEKIQRNKPYLHHHPPDINSPHLYYLQNHLPFHHSNQLQNTTFQEKDTFFRYASSLLQIGSEEEEKQGALHVYQQSQLINPPQSLIEKYQVMKKNGLKDQIKVDFGKQRNIQKNNSIELAITKIKKVLSANDHKSERNESFMPTSLIDILAISSVESVSKGQERSLLAKAFAKLKRTFVQSTPIDYFYVDRLQYESKKSASNINRKRGYQDHQFQLHENKKQGTEQTIGVLTFKVLMILSETFQQLKAMKQKQLRSKFQILSLTMQRFLLKKAFQCIRQYMPLDPYKYDSLTLSKSTQKRVGSKLKFNSFNASTEKKISVKKFFSHQHQCEIKKQESMESHFKERIISSEIVQNFDYHDLKSKVSDGKQSTEKKIEFNFKLKKKSTRQTISQAQTINSKKSFQSQYQAAKGTTSSYQKPISVRNFYNEEPDYNRNRMEELPTQKLISSKQKRQRQNMLYQKRLFDEVQIVANNPIAIFSSQKRRYIAVRTNLYQLPILSETSFKQQTYDRKSTEQMVRFYHMIPDGVLNVETFEDQKEDQATKMNANTRQSMDKMRNAKSEKQLSSYKQLIENEQRKKKLKNKKEKERIESYYFSAQTQVKKKQMQLNTKNPQTNQTSISSKERTEVSNRVQKEIINNKEKQGFKAIITQDRPGSFLVVQPSESSLNNHNITQQSLLKSKHQNQPTLLNQKHKLKIKKDNNYGEYYSGQPIRSNSKINIKVLGSTLRRNSPNAKESGFASKDLVIKSPSNKLAIKSLSPRIRMENKQSYETGVLANRIIRKEVILNKNINQQQTAISPTSPVDFGHMMGKREKVNSQFTTQIINIAPKRQSIIILQQNTIKPQLRQDSMSPKPISLSPIPNNFINNLIPDNSTQKRGSFYVTNVPSNIRPVSRPSSNCNYNIVEGSAFTPSNSNLSNQPSFNMFNLPSGNVHKVINFGPNHKNEGQFTDRHSSILSTHSNQSKQKIIDSKSSKIIRMVNKNPHLLSKPQHMFVNSPRLIQKIQRNMNIQSPRQSQDTTIKRHKKGLSIFMNKSSSIRQTKDAQTAGGVNPSSKVKGLSNQKTFLTLSK